MTAALSAFQRDLARHALGLPNPSNRACRNHHVVGRGGRLYKAWTAMVWDGFAIMQLGGSEFTDGDDPIFRLTWEGASLALAPGEGLDPEARYDRAAVDPRVKRVAPILFREGFSTQEICGFFDMSASAVVEILHDAQRALVAAGEGTDA